MSRNIVDRIGIAKAVAAGATKYDGLPMNALADEAADVCWRIADRIVTRAEAMRAEDVETAKEERDREIAEQAELDAKICQRPVAEGFEGPCTMEPHGDELACENKAGDKW